MGACPRLTAAKHTRALIHQTVPCGQNVSYLVTDMVHAAIRVAFQKGSNR